MNEILCSNVKCKRTLEETWKVCHYCGQKVHPVAPVARCAVCDSAAPFQLNGVRLCDVHYQEALKREHEPAPAHPWGTPKPEPPKPPYGFRLVDKVKDQPKQKGDIALGSNGKWFTACFSAPFEDDYTYARAIDPEQGYRLLREDAVLPEYYEFTRCGKIWHYGGTQHGMKVSDYIQIPACVGTLAIRVPVSEPSKPEPVCAMCRNSIEEPEFPKPISDLSGLPEGKQVLAFDQRIGVWTNTTPFNLRKHWNSDHTHWMPMLPSPVPPQKSQRDIDDDAFFSWAAVELPGDKGDHHDAFRAGIAHARKRERKA